MIRIEAVEVDEHILDKIASKHGVSLDEVEEACLGDHVSIRRTRRGLYKVFGQTQSGRYILSVLSYLGKGVCRVVTARDMTEGERRLYKR